MAQDDWRERYELEQSLWYCLTRPVECAEQNRRADHGTTVPTDTPQQNPFGVVHCRKAIAAQPKTDEERHRLAEEEYWCRSLRKQRNLNRITLVAAVAGLAGIGVLLKTLNATRIAADAAKIQATTAQREFELSERPWVYVKNISPNDDLTYNKRGARYSFRFTLSNVGHSPAAATWVYIDPYFTGMGKTIDYLIAQRATCDPLRKRKRNSRTLGTTLFPGQEKIFPQDVFVKPASSADIFDGTFVGCIDYQFEFAEGHHQTPIIFSVDKRKPGYPGAFAIMPNEVVPAFDLLIDEWIEAVNAD